MQLNLFSELLGPCANCQIAKYSLQFLIRFPQLKKTAHLSRDECTNGKETWNQAGASVAQFCWQVAIVFSLSLGKVLIVVCNAIGQVRSNRGGPGTNGSQWKSADACWKQNSLKLLFHKVIISKNYYSKNLQTN